MGPDRKADFIGMVVAAIVMWIAAAWIKPYFDALSLGQQLKYGGIFIGACLAIAVLVDMRARAKKR